jgi:hypothetical protein
MECQWIRVSPISRTERRRLRRPLAAVAVPNAVDLRKALNGEGIGFGPDSARIASFFGPVGKLIVSGGINDLIPDGMGRISFGVSVYVWRIDAEQRIDIGETDPARGDVSALRS